MAHKKAGGSTGLGRDSQAKRLGIKMFDGQIAKAGSILVRQRGSKVRAGKNVKKGGDDTLFSKISGIIKFQTKNTTKFNGNREKTKFVNVLPEEKK